VPKGVVANLDRTLLNIGGLAIGTWATRKRVISSGQKNWRYIDTKDGPDSKDWIKPDFDDSKWKKGDAPLGYGDNGDTKVVSELGYGPDANNKYRAAFFRLKFSVEEARIRRKPGSRGPLLTMARCSI